jgi:uncharacterized protein (TIGR03083 family)
MDIGVVYAGQQERLASLVLESADRVGQQVPACPEWEVRDVLAHVVGLARDAVGGNLPTMDLLEQWRDDGVAEERDRMTARQVDLASGRSVDDLVHDWRGLTDSLSPMLSGRIPFPDPAPFGLSAILVTDLYVHEQDVRSALGSPRMAEGPDLSLALASYSFAVDYRIRQLDLPALEVRYGDKSRVLGPGGPAAAVGADRFELVRALAGRRSPDQILALEWEGDPTPYLPIIPAYGERVDPLVE